MRNKFLLLFVSFCVVSVNFIKTAAAENTEYLDQGSDYGDFGSPVSADSADPLFMLKMGDILSESAGGFLGGNLRLSQKLSYGFTNRFSLGADIKYQQNFNNSDDGFSNIGFSGVYRLSSINDVMTSQAIFGVNFSGSNRIPDFSNNVYFGGLRFGRQFSWVTLSGTIKTSWIFDDVLGRAYIDFIPEAYFRLSSTWMFGAGADFQKSTIPEFDEEWVNFKLVKKYGSTQYIGHIDYEFESEEYRVGAKINILF